jgi:hypothetical protein
MIVASDVPKLNRHAPLAACSTRTPDESTANDTEDPRRTRPQQQLRRVRIRRPFASDLGH